MQLSAPQSAAVEHMGSPALVVAGAGSGKTRTLTAKIAHLVHQGYDPQRILGITFTNKAADEMKRRLVALVDLPLGSFPWVRTYHSACFRILKQHCACMGFEPPLQIYPEYQQLKTIKDLLAKLNLDKKHAQLVRALISNAKNSGDPLAYIATRSHVGHMRLLDIFNSYEQILRRRNSVDFDNILLLTRDLLRTHSDIRRAYQERFQFILVDEYQDTNNLQEELTGLLLRDGNLFCVGDDWQAIYSFRGSNVRHFLTFRDKYPNAKIFRLEQNYRSADEIVQVANDLIDNNPHRMNKACFSSKQGGTVEIHSFFDEYEEADWVAGHIQILHDRNVPYEQMAVLYRTKFSSLPFEQVLRRNRIPYRMLGSKGFFERKEVLDLHCYLAAAVYPRDDVAFERIVNTPKRGVGPAMLKKIRSLRGDNMSLQDAARRALREKLLTPKVYGAIDLVLTLLDDIKTMPPEQALNEVIQRIHYMEHLQEYSRASDVTARIENIEQLLFSASQHQQLIDYLEESSLVKEDKEDEEENQTTGVNLSTVHASKGLEYQAVFIVGCEEQLFPHWKAMESEEDLQEERRLMYVAVTRSERYLYITNANYRRGQFNHKSRFVEEIEDAM